MYVWQVQIMKKMAGVLILKKAFYSKIWRFQDFELLRILFWLQFDKLLFQIWSFYASNNGILLRKLFWPTVRKNCSWDWEKHLEIWGWRQRICKKDLNSTLQWKVRTIFGTIRMTIGEKSYWDVEIYRNKLEKIFFFKRPIISVCYSWFSKFVCLFYRLCGH